MDNMSKYKLSTSMAHVHVNCESKLRSVVRSSMHPFPDNWVAIGRAVMYARTAHVFIAGMSAMFTDGVH